MPPIDYSQLVAQPYMAPRAWQARAPEAMYDTSAVPVAPAPDITRIAALPRRARPTDDQAPLLIDGVPRSIGPVIDGLRGITRDNPNCNCAVLFEEHGMVDEQGVPRPCIKAPRMIQAWSLMEMHTQNGLLGLIGVGHGKTYLDLLAPWAIPNCKTALLLVPPKLIEQLDRDYRFLREHHHMPSIIFHSKKGTDEIIPGRPALHVLPYSMLQTTNFTSYIEQRIRPDVIIADECHRLKNADTATTGRVLRYFHAHPECRFCGWTGSMTNKSIKDYAHLAALALRHRSPLPIDPECVADVARAIDPITRKNKENEYARPAPPGALEVLFDSSLFPGENIRHAWRRRLSDTPGIITTTNASVDAKLEINMRTPPPIPESVAKALRDMRVDWLRPDGMVYPDAMQRAAGALQLSCGFFYRWRFPLVHGKPQDQVLIDQWKATRSAWNSEVRKAIKSRRENFDSEKLARNAAERAHGVRPITDRKLPVWHSLIYPAWSDIEHKVVHETEAIWLDEWLANDAAEWANTHRGIVWYQMSAFGEKVAQLSGCDMHCGGPDAGKLIERVDGKRSIVASIASHGTGRDGLQYKYREQLIGNFPSSNDKDEQLLGRLHRDGQKADVVTAAFYAHTPELCRAINTALISADYVGNTTPGAQKLLDAGMNLLDDEIDEGDMED